MGIRDNRGNSHLRRCLLKHRPELRQESLKVQDEIANLLKVSTMKSKQHKTEAGHMYISYQEIYQKFGREGGMELLTTRYGIFTSPGEFSVKEGTTRAFKVAADLDAAMDEYFSKWAYRSRRPPLVSNNGKAIRTLPAAISSLDDEKRNAQAQGKDKVMSFVPVPVPLMKKYCKALKRLKGPQQDLFAGSGHQRIDEHLDAVGRLMDSTNSHDGQIGVMHRYQEKQSGRLYTDGVSLQNIRSAVKNVALSGDWEYDIENCHFSILHQMAGQYGLDLPAVGYYLAHKGEVRQQISDEVGISLKQAKKCLISLIYGSTDSHRDPHLQQRKRRKADAIPGEIGLDAALRLYKHPRWIALRGDVSKGRLRIIKKWPRSRQSFINAMGKGIRAEARDKNKPEILAHLVQGVEAKMLEVVRLLYPNALSLMQHDGFTSRMRLDKNLIEEEITEATGYVVKMEETPSQVPADFGIPRD